jgi:phosphate transport system substrate-binding protein
MAYTQMQNSSGVFVEPNSESFKSAAAGADWSKVQDYYLIMTNAGGKKSWPIAGSTFVIMQKTQANSDQALAVLKFFKWAYLHGNNMAEELHYVPLPKAVTTMVEKTWKENVKTADGKPATTGL